MKYRTIKNIVGKKMSRIITKRHLDYDVDSKLDQLTINWNRRINQHRYDLHRDLSYQI
jgi:hypothetical protein